MNAENMTLQSGFMIVSQSVGERATMAPSLIASITLGGRPDGLR